MGISYCGTLSVVPCFLDPKCFNFSKLFKFRLFYQLLQVPVNSNKQQVGTTFSKLHYCSEVMQCQLWKSKQHNQANEFQLMFTWIGFYTVEKYIIHNSLVWEII